MQTFKKLPTAKPKRKIKIETEKFIGVVTFPIRLYFVIALLFTSQTTGKYWLTAVFLNNRKCLKIKGLDFVICDLNR